MELRDLRKVLVVGCGTMGQQIAFQCAAHGYAVTIYDKATEALQAAKKRLRAYAAYLTAEKHIGQGLAEKAILGIGLTGVVQQAAEDADLLIEAIPEELALKSDVFATFDGLCPSRTVFTTNASLLMPSQMAQATGRSDRFLALHFHQPVWVGSLADVMPHAGTLPAVVSLVRDFARAIGQIPLVLKKENYGYVFNAIYNELSRAAIALAANGVADVEDIDRAWMAVMKMSVGPLGMLDQAGLDTVWQVTNHWAENFKDPQNVKNARFLKCEYLDRGWLGVKSGRGFYSYPHPAYQNPGFIRGE